jgi:hypothetical protein
VDLSSSRDLSSGFWTGRGWAITLRREDLTLSHEQLAIGKAGPLSGHLHLTIGQVLVIQPVEPSHHLRNSYVVKKVSCATRR